MVLMIVWSAFSIVVLVSELWFGEAGANTEPYNPTLHFGHLNLILVCSLQNICDATFLCLFEASNYYFTLWASWWKGVSLPCGVVWGQSTFPPPCTSRLEEHNIEIVYCLSVCLSLHLLFHCHFCGALSLLSCILFLF